MRTVTSLLIIAACTTLLLGAGSVRAVAPPPTPAGRQLEWLLTKLNGSSVPSNVELKRHFSPRFLRAVPPEDLLGALAPVWSGRPLRLGAVLARDGRLGVRVRVTTRTGASFRVVLVVSSESSHARRRQLLGRVDALEPTVRAATDWTGPRSIDQIEWFASPADLGHAMATLVDRARRPGLQAVRSILAINPGIQLDRELWPYVGFKGGSEPGVLSLTWYLQRRDERKLVLSIVINDSGHDIDTVAAVGVARAAIGLLARS